MERVPPTRMGLLNTRARRGIAVEGTGLLRSKREALASDLFRLMHGLVAERERLEESLRIASKALTLARALDGKETLVSLALAGAREIPAEIVRRKVWGIPTPEVTWPRLLRSRDARGASPHSFNLGAAEAARAHEEALEILLTICSREIRLRRLGEEIQKTSRRINALEQFLIPRLDGEKSRIELALEEREREDRSRPKRIRGIGLFSPSPISRLGRALLLLVLALPPRASWGSEAVPQRFRGYYQELQEAARRGPFGFPLQVRSEERGDLVRAEALGIMDHALQAFGAAVTEPASWCEFLPLNLNIKACTIQWDAREPLVTLYIGGKGYLSPESASQQPYRFVVQARQREYVAVSLSALRGVLGTKEHQIEFEAASISGRAVVALRSSYEHSAASRLATAVYLATVGRDKVGFSRERVSPDGQASFVKGAQGMIERSLMRYYLILKAFLDTQALPDARRFDARLNAVYDLMER
jgi:V/A-type H+-transporting ATPase subunit D